jgi:menaquinone-dependent protoporphyrinogen oxidase
MVDAAQVPEALSVDGYSAAIVSASVHRAKHEREIIDFVKAHLAEFEHLPTAFLSVSLSEAGAEDSAASPERRAQSAADVERMIEVFLDETRWHPTRIKAVAGALKFTKYTFLLRFVMKGLDRFVDEAVQSIPGGTPISSSRAVATR